MKEIKKAVSSLNSISKSVSIRVISHYDSDGATAAAILCKALYRKGYGFHATLLKHPFEEELSKIKEEENEFIIFSDMGSDRIDAIKEFDCPSIIIDHHQPSSKESTIDSIVHINANLLGFDGNYEASGAGMCYLFAVELNRQNTDLSPLALTGAIGDKQHLGGFTGLNRKIFEEAISGRFLRVERRGLKIMGKVGEIFLSIDPYFHSLSGREERIGDFLREISISRESRYEDLPNNERKRLHSALILNLLKNGIRPEMVDAVIDEMYVSDDFPTNLARFSDIIDSCGKSGETGVALAVSLGDREKYEEAREIDSRYRRILIKKLISLENGELEDRKNIQYFRSSKASIGSILSGVVMNYFPYKKKPTFSFTKREDGAIHISCRATRELVMEGIDLGKVMREVASQFGGKGGGHKIAAGGTLRGIEEEELISLLDKRIGRCR